MTIETFRPQLKATGNIQPHRWENPYPLLAASSCQINSLDWTMVPITTLAILNAGTFGLITSHPNIIEKGLWILGAPLLLTPGGPLSKPRIALYNGTRKAVCVENQCPIGLLQIFRI